VFSLARQPPASKDAKRVAPPASRSSRGLQWQGTIGSVLILLGHYRTTTLCGDSGSVSYPIILQATGKANVRSSLSAVQKHQLGGNGRREDLQSRLEKREPGVQWEPVQGHSGALRFIQTPAKGAADSSSPPDVTTLCTRVVRVATYHTHAAYDSRLTMSTFVMLTSAMHDNAASRYLWDPGNVIRKCDPATDHVTTFHSRTN